MDFNLDDLKKNLGYFSRKFGNSFIVSLGELLDNCDDIESLEEAIYGLFLSRGTTYYVATAEAGMRLSSPTGTDQSKQSENQPVQNEIIEVVGKKIDTLKQQGEAADGVKPKGSNS